MPNYRPFTLGNHKPILSDLELFCVLSKSEYTNFYRLGDVKIKQSMKNIVAN
ncbi:hypothetical protein [Nostoc sp.]|uniref:hypothetical protein n=1 Tax=Nostoc sp. TaxID=1180 RepID=UPI002FF89226